VGIKKEGKGGTCGQLVEGDVSLAWGEDDQKRRGRRCRYGPEEVGSDEEGKRPPTGKGLG
jgi:hypothetical protein